MRMKQFGLVSLLVLTFAASVSAQSANSANKLRWDELAQAPAVATSASYNPYADGSATAGGALASVTCVAAVAPLNPASDSTCTANFPAFTPGNHTLAITQVLSGAESTKSNTLTFQFVVAVVPTQLRIVRLLGGALRGSVLTSQGRQRLLRNQDIRSLHRVN